MTEHSYELKGGLSQTKSKLKTLNFVEIWEKYSIYGSLVFFCSVVSFIILRRTKVLLYFVMWLMSFLNTSANGPLPDLAFTSSGNSMEFNDEIELNSENIIDVDLEKDL